MHIYKWMNKWTKVLFWNGRIAKYVFLIQALNLIFLEFNKRKIKVKELLNVSKINISLGELKRFL